MRARQSRPKWPPPCSRCSKRILATPRVSTGPVAPRMRRSAPRAAKSPPSWAAIKGAFFAARGRANHIVTSRIEHPSTIEPCRFLEGFGAEVTYLPVDGAGRVNPDDVRQAITDRTVLVSIMHANNEVGTIQPIEEIARIARGRGVLMHTDAAQSVGKIQNPGG